MRAPRRGAALALLGLLALAAPAAAAEMSQRYDVYAGGIRLGSLGVEGRVSGGRYAASARVAGGGLVGLFVTFDFSGTSEGRVLPDGSLRPERYRATSDDGETRRTVTIAYNAGRPASVTYDPPRRSRPYDASPAEQSGTLDPISATFALLADARTGEACDRTVEIFDGNRRSRIRVEPRRANGPGEWVCEGAYVRVDGFSEKLLSERRSFPFTMIWRETEGVMQVVRFQTQTTFGRVSAIRR